MSNGNKVMMGKYELLGLLATGGMAEIYLARQTGIGGFKKLVVVKKILPHLAREKSFVEMFLDEAVIAAQLNHPRWARTISSPWSTWRARAWGIWPGKGTG